MLREVPRAYVDHVASLLTEATIRFGVGERHEAWMTMKHVVSELCRGCFVVCVIGVCCCCVVV
jgi:hypothetical protein